MVHNDGTSDGQGIVTAQRTVRIERLLPGPAERLWNYLTEPGKRRLWLATGVMEPHVGGGVEHLFRHRELSSEETPERYRPFENSPAMHGKVTLWDPPRTLAYTWPGDHGSSEITFELFPEGGKVLLVLTHRRLADLEAMVSVASGWDAHLGVLAARLEGVEPHGFWSAHARLEAIYRERLALTTEQGVTPEHGLRLEREYDATPAAIYAAWTEPDIMRRWFGKVDADVRIGGSWSVETPGDEGEVYRHAGRYLALEPDRFVKKTFSIASDEPNPYTDEFVAISLHPAPGGRTRLVFDNGWNGPAPTAEDVEAAKAGWSIWLDMLGEMLEKNPELRGRT